ncbi:MAG: phosphodiester glycosidase family protein [Verrucomicrobia bacterium]|nr:phosphodiester glycosidase family protein [Verrucomicrobiota bacterium]
MNSNRALIQLRLTGASAEAALRLLVVLLLASLWCSHGQVSTTNRPLPGVSLFSETRTNPPTRLFVAFIDLTEPGLRLRVSRGGPDPDGAGPWQTTLMRPTEIAARDGLDFVVNGDFYRVPAMDDPVRTNAVRGFSWSAVNGPAVSQGTTWSATSQRRPCLVVDRRGKGAIKLLARPEPQDWEVVAGNTMLVRDGVAVPHENKVRHPRTAVGLNQDATQLVVLVVDGRKPGVAIGMNYDELAAELIRLGCHSALNLDGGGSSLMAVRTAARNGFEILNVPTDGRERPVANVLGVSVTRPAAAPNSRPTR